MKRAYWVAGALALAVVLLLLSGAIGSPPRGNPPAAAVPMSPQIVEWLPRLQGPPAISGELRVDPYRLVRLKVSDLPPRAGVLWSVYPPGKADIAHTSDRCCLEFVAPPGSYTVELLVIALDESGVPVPWKTTATVVIGGEPGPTPPVPPGPVPPGPVPPGPVPPDPTPPTPPAPIPVAGFRVLIVYETSKAPSLPEGQRSILYGKAIRDYLDRKCVTGQDGKTREWRIWDQDVDTSLAGKVWQDAMSRKRGSVPWLIVSNGQSGFEGPLPATVDDTLTLLKKYGGD